MLYRFGQFQFDARTRLLYRADERIPLTPKAADLLLVLLQHERQLLGKEELIRLVWPDTFVEDGNLSKHIFFLRKTLEENGESAELIETVPKRGYRFIGPVEHTSGGKVAEVSIEEGTREHVVIEETDDAPPPVRPARRPVLVLACLALVLAGGVAWAIWARSLAGPELRSLLVLPFANPGQHAGNEYLSDGLAEELIAAFSSIKELRVIPRTTAFQFKGKSGDLASIGHRLGVEAVLDGSVQSDGGRLRIRLALTRVRDGKTLWSHSYDRTAQDVFETENEVADSVVRALFPNNRRSVDMAPPTGTRNVEAHNLYLKGNFLRQKFFDSSLVDALALFQKAAQLDPSYAQAWAAQAFCYLEIGHGYQRFPRDVFPMAVQAAQRALHLNPRLALAHVSLGYLNLEFIRDRVAAKRELETAISLDPNDGESHHWMSHYWISLGRFREADTEASRGVECDPLNFSIGAHLAFTKYEEGRFAEAIDAAAATLQLDPLHGPTNWYQMRSYEESGELLAAIGVRRHMGWINPSAEELEAGLRESGAPGFWRVSKESILARRRAHPVRPTEIAWIYAHLGDRERALEWLERAVEERDGWAIYMKVEPPFAAFRSDPRFQRIAATAGLE
ncbi:MAG: hypothetical protein QOJ99_4093 [Bryobacterales bacterium]|nr:hypothetical protein [Bryobacterales bacterium]